MKKLISESKKYLCDLKKFIIDTNSTMLIILLILLLLFIYILFLICQYLGKFFLGISLNSSLIEPFILFFTIVASFIGVVYSSYQSNENQKHQMQFDKIYNQLLYLSGKDEYYLGDMSLLKSLLSEKFFQPNKIKIINNIIKNINYNHVLTKAVIFLETEINEKINSIKDIDLDNEKIEKELEDKVKEELLNQYPNGIYTTKKELENKIDEILQENMNKTFKIIIEKELKNEINKIDNEIKSLKKNIKDSFEEIKIQLSKLIEDKLDLLNFGNEIINVPQNTTSNGLNVLSTKNQIILKYIIFYLLDSIHI